MSEGLTEKHMSVIEEAFHAYDADNDNEVTPAELVEAMKRIKLNISLKAAERMIAQYDTDNSGTLQLDEFKAMILKTTKFRQIFNALDTDHSGYITKDEMKQHLKNINVCMSDEEVQAMIEDIDTDGDGKIDLKEFTSFLTFLKEQEYTEQHQ